MVHQTPNGMEKGNRKQLFIVCSKAKMWDTRELAKARLAADNRVVFVPCLWWPLLHDAQLQKVMKNFKRKNILKNQMQSEQVCPGKHLHHKLVGLGKHFGRASQLALQFLYASQNVRKMPTLVQMSVWTEQVRLSQAGHVPAPHPIHFLTYLLVAPQLTRHILPAEEPLWVIHCLLFP